MDDNQDYDSFEHQAAIYYNGEDLQVLSTESVDDQVLHEMLTAALWALEQRMAGERIALAVH